ncbi:MAG TPA: thermonuclease family protein [Micropepsaceae bacterium]|nr:thermonuclease family protein [Micropepsaceae bacterium]
MAEHRAWSLPGLAAGLLLLVAASDEAGLAPWRGRVAAEALEGPVSAVVQRVVDGDTIEVRAAIWLGQTLTVRVRINGVDAPELEARCAEERQMALAARDFLVRRLEGAAVKLTGVSYDKYGGRVRANVADGKGDVANALLASGLARPYHGERRQPWCVAT